MPPWWASSVGENGSSAKPLRVTALHNLMGGGQWTMQEWMDWLSATPLVGSYMKKAIDAGKQDFEATEFLNG